ncbi:hypothetical protein GGR54DRAFT_619220 [Hypoxylon sp. NC1633]|nr:hypothetical protein GGR54DRAFT_619220 [Hypoxylon sp. NC1633]
MSEYWKSTPKYWCKHCSTYVRDTKFERQNHEATAKHQGNLKRFLRDIHRNHEQEQREKDRAKREIERLNGVVGSPSANHGTSTNKASSATSSHAKVTDIQRQRQWEQLADMGIDVPTELRGEMAMVGEWTITNTRVLEAPKPDHLDAKSEATDAIVSGVRKRSKGEVEEQEEEGDNAIKNLFKKPRKWGRDTKQVPGNDAELDALLNRTLPNADKSEGQLRDLIKREEDPRILKESLTSGVKKEDPDDEQALSSIKIPTSSDVETPLAKPGEGAEGETHAVVFKKRKPKNIRQR